MCPLSLFQVRIWPLEEHRPASLGQQSSRHSNCRPTRATSVRPSVRHSLTLSLHLSGRPRPSPSSPLGLDRKSDCATRELTECITRGFGDSDRCPRYYSRSQGKGGTGVERLSPSPLARRARPPAPALSSVGWAESDKAIIAAPHLHLRSKSKSKVGAAPSARP